MKLSWGFMLASLHYAAAASPVAHIYIHDPEPKASSQAPSSVNLETARLILAHRLGLSRFHSMKNPSDETVQQINTFGGSQQKLFGGEDAERTKAHVLVWVDDVEDARAIISDPSTWQSSFTIPKPPPASDNDRLIQDMILQADSLPKKPDPKGNTYKTSTCIDRILSELKQTAVYNDYLTVLRADKNDGFSLNKFAATITKLRRETASHGREGFPITVVIMPPSPFHSKRSAQPWGTYDLPNLEPRRELPEVPLSPISAKPSASPNNNVVPDLEDFPVITQTENKNNTPPLGILPICYKTASDCVKVTNNCTGHGECKLLHEGEGGSGGRSNCYGCACTPTVVKVGDTGMETHKKTTYWGGPACQKKDVSVPFWLFVGSGVLLAFLISTGIGMLYSIGDEELPSVIGAGVSGPVRK